MHYKLLWSLSFPTDKDWWPSLISGGMVVSRGYSMKLLTRRQRVREASVLHTFLRCFCVSVHIPYCALSVPKWLSVSSGCILALLQKVSSFHSSLFPHLTVSCACWLKMWEATIILMTWCLLWCIETCIICSIVEQWGHDRWIFTGAELVSTSSVM